MAEDLNIALTGIYNAYVDQIYRYCSYRLYSKDLAEDATSAVFIKLVQRFSELQHKSSPEIRRWLFGVASNVVAAHRRQKKHQQEIFTALSRAPNSGLVRDEPTFHRIDWPILYGAMSQLTDRQQDILILRFFHGMGTAEIAPIVEMTHVAVRVTLMRTLRKLKEILKESFEGDQAGSP
jgi:RNA polymerase sigma-70 factor (ECF subfamily)